ncbi:hypothetical protein [Ruminococcus difficilis]|uniref:Uncharacterized protein n=1 Tax=Ruminococcus difficilis TaxID=2763069 RepID=A0A935C3A0_9FIRM|nr:hypothetical protein [Ruminococcus difficilis]MBK6089669.1 hypothetical protein [Ruminococcus difficilis]
MNENKQHDTAPEEYIPNPAKLIPPFLVSIAATMAGDTALFYKQIAPALLFYVIVAISIVWIIRAEMKKERADYHMWRRVSDALNKVDGFEDRLNKFETDLSLKADKPARSNIRPGSRQSDRYKKMTGGATGDNRREDQRDSAV